MTKVVFQLTEKMEYWIQDAGIARYQFILFITKIKIDCHLPPCQRKIQRFHIKCLEFWLAWKPCQYWALFSQGSHGLVLSWNSGAFQFTTVSTTPCCLPPGCLQSSVCLAWALKSLEFVAPELRAGPSRETQGTFEAGFLLLDPFILIFLGGNTDLEEGCGLRASAGESESWVTTEEWLSLSVPKFPPLPGE